MPRILLIEDDIDITRNLTRLLCEEGFSVSCSATRKAALDLLERESVDLVLLDLMLPDGNGYSICTQIRKERGIPVIFLTAMGDEASVVTGLDLGADDYISKPFRPLELVSRIKNVLRRRGPAQTLFQTDGLTVDTTRATVFKNGTETSLSALEYRLLLVFLNHRGQVLSRERLLEEIWDTAGDFVNDNTLTVYIKRLREKIEDDPSAPAILKTVRGLGYKLGE